MIKIKGNFQVSFNILLQFLLGDMKWKKFKNNLKNLVHSEITKIVC